MQLEPSSQNTMTMKSLTACILPCIEYTYKDKQFEKGCALVLMSTSQFNSRKKEMDDGALRFMSGLCSKNPANHPKWEENLNVALSDLGSWGYEPPSADGHNLSALQAVLTVDGKETVYKAEGAWAFQYVAQSMSNLMLMFQHVLGTYA